MFSLFFAWWCVQESLQLTLLVLFLLFVEMLKAPVREDVYPLVPIPEHLCVCLLSPSEGWLRRAAAVSNAPGSESVCL